MLRILCWPGFVIAAFAVILMVIVTIGEWRKEKMDDNIFHVVITLIFLLFGTICGLVLWGPK